MFNALSSRIPDELVTMIIWNYIDPIPLSEVKRHRRRLNAQFKNPILFLVHEELLRNTNLKLNYIDSISKSCLLR